MVILYVDYPSYPKSFIVGGKEEGNCTTLPVVLYKNVMFMYICPISISKSITYPHDLYVPIQFTNICSL